jgi:hypothetical protein
VKEVQAVVEVKEVKEVKEVQAVVEVKEVKEVQAVVEGEMKGSKYHNLDQLPNAKPLLPKIKQFCSGSNCFMNMSNPLNDNPFQQPRGIE